MVPASKYKVVKYYVPYIEKYYSKYIPIYFGMCDVKSRG